MNANSHGKKTLFITLIVVMLFAQCNQPKVMGKIKNIEMEKIGDIIGTDIENGKTPLWEITSIDTDNSEQIYIADSGNNKIFVFDKSGKYINTIGRPGQGPGEFMAGINSNGLRVSIGNNEKIYVYDCLSRRMSIFKKDGALEMTVALFSDGPAIIDTPHVNKKGDVYLVTYYRNNIIQIFNYKMSWIKGIMNESYHFGEIIVDNINNPSELFTSEHHVNVVITEDDQLYALSNYLMKIYGFNQNGNIEWKIDPKECEEFRKEYTQRLSISRKRGVKFIFCRLLSLPNNQLGISYYSHIDRKWNIYIFDIFSRSLSGIMQFPEMNASPIHSDKNGHIYCLNENSDCILIYRKKEIT